MQHDILGNPVTAMRERTLRAVDDFVEGFLAYETRAEGILAAAEVFPECCIANVYAGYLWMFLEAPDAALHASQYLAAAALRAWAADDLPEAVRLCDLVSDEFPRDLVVVKIHQYFEFNRGNSPEMLRVALKVSPVNADLAYLHGMSAFAYEQCHLLDEAESA